LKVVGVDLAGSPKNPTGVCVLSEEKNLKTVRTELLHSDQEIISKLDELKPDLVALDAPITFEGKNRRCDRELKEYGALPVTLSGMEVLALRGKNLHEKLKEKHKVIEVYATASAKILGVYHKEDFICQKKLLALDLEGDPNNRILTRDELDAVFAAITGFLHIKGQTKAVGDEEGTIIIPNV
jgi:predicted nuclease with RNAse H fold